MRETHRIAAGVGGSPTTIQGTITGRNGVGRRNYQSKVYHDEVPVPMNRAQDILRLLVALAFWY